MFLSVLLIKITSVILMARYFVIIGSQISQMLWNWLHHGTNERISKKFRNNLQRGEFIATEVNVYEFTNKYC